MKISPTLTEVKEIAKTGKYDILPVSCEILSDFIYTYRGYEDSAECFNTLLSA